MKMRLGLIVFFLFCFGAASGQAELRLDTGRISIGQPTLLKISFTYRADAPETFPQWPVIGDTLTGGIEILSRTSVDTVIADKALDPFVFRQQMTLTITHWEGGFYPIVPFVFLTEGNAVESNALLLEVVVPEIDEEGEIEDIKDIRDAKLSFLDWVVLYWYWIVAVMAFLAFLVFLIRFARKKKKPSAPVIINVVQVPTEDEALEKLKKLLAKQQWLHGLVKEHHSEVSEIFRNYLEKRFGFNALEMTTDEILREMKLRDVANESMGEISKILKLTDLVKFAKANPLLHENEDVVRQAMLVINRHRTEKQ